MSDLSNALREKGPYPKDSIKRIWMNDSDGTTIHVILTSSGWDRFSVKKEHPHYQHYSDILTLAQHGGWID